MQNKIYTLITGASGGIGIETVKLALERGYVVIAAYRNSEKTHLFDSLVKKYTRNKLVLVPNFDLEDKNARLDSIKEIKKITNKLHYFIHVAGFLDINPLFKLNNENIYKSFEINYFSAIELISKISRMMLIAKDHDRAVTLVTSVSSRLGTPGRLAYSSAKGALETASRVLANELGGKKIRVNCVCPGLVNTKMLTDYTSDEEIEIMKGRTSLKRVGEPYEIANLILFLSSEKASYITGQVLNIDGGLL